MQNSRCRDAARTSSRFATFVQAMSSTKPTAASSTSSAGRTPPTSCSRSGSTRTVQPALKSGYSCADLRGDPCSDPLRPRCGVTTGLQARRPSRGSCRSASAAARASARRASTAPASTRTRMLLATRRPTETGTQPGITPTTVAGSPFTRSDRPAMSGVPSNRRRHSPSPMTTTGPAVEVGRNEGPADDWRDAEHVEELDAHPHGADPLRIAGAGQVRAIRTHRRERRERGVAAPGSHATLPGEDGKRSRPSRCWMSALYSHGVTRRSASGNGSGRSSVGVDDAEDRSVGAETEREGHDRDHRERRPARESLERLAHRTQLYDGTGTLQSRLRAMYVQCNGEDGSSRMPKLTSKGSRTVEVESGKRLVLAIEEDARRRRAARVRRQRALHDVPRRVHFGRAGEDDRGRADRAGGEERDRRAAVVPDCSATTT